MCFHMDCIMVKTMAVHIGNKFPKRIIKISGDNGWDVFDFWNNRSYLVEPMVIKMVCSKMNIDKGDRGFLIKKICDKRAAQHSITDDCRSNFSLGIAQGYIDIM